VFFLTFAEKPIFKDIKINLGTKKNECCYAGNKKEAESDLFIFSFFVLY